MSIFITIVILIIISGLIFILIKQKKNKNKNSDKDNNDNVPVVPDVPDQQDIIPPEPPKNPTIVKIISITPNNAGTNVPEGIFCTRTPSITVVDEIVGCDSCEVKREWFDNDKLRATDAKTINKPFTAGHFIKYQVSVGDITDFVVIKIV